MKYLWLIPAALVLFAAVLCINTLRKSALARRLTQPAKLPDEARSARYAERLSRMIACRTVSVKGEYDDTEFARLRDVMAELFPLVHSHAERLTFGEDCWMYCLPGADTARNILLMSHHDVVAAGEGWSHDPFGGETADGRLWGRGTVDTKTPLFAEFTALEEILEGGGELPCNIWIGSSHNEELGGDGIPLALEYFKEKGISFEVILDEGGAVIEPPLGGMRCEKCAMVAVHEKGRYYLNCTADAAGGHASLTAAAQATPVERMAGLISRVRGGNIFVRRLNPQLRAMFSHLAPYCSFPMNVLLSNLWCFGGLLRAVMPKLNAQAGGLLGTTCSFSRISSEGGACEATAFLRPVDEHDLEADIQAFTRLAAEYGITVQLGEGCEYHAPADISRPLFAYTMDCIARVFPQYPAAPFILPAGTDARTLTDVCPCVLRFAPIRLSAQQLASVHSAEENIDLDAIADAVDFYRLFVEGCR